MEDVKSNGTLENGAHKERRILFESMDIIMANLKENIEHIDKNFKYTQKFINVLHDGIINKRRFFLLASGRSAFILQCFATRLVHLGAEVHIITNLGSIPALRKKDLLIVLSGSGTTPIVLSMLKNYINTLKPHSVVVITSHPETMIGRVGDITILLKGRSKSDHRKNDDTAILTPEGTQFEICAFCYLDALIAELAVKMGEIDDENMSQKHSQIT